MIWKTERVCKRKDNDWLHGRDKETHVELVKKETWWFLIFPLYSRTTVINTNL